MSDSDRRKRGIEKTAGVSTLRIDNKLAERGMLFGERLSKHAVDGMKVIPSILLSLALFSSASLVNPTNAPNSIPKPNPTATP